MNIIIEKKPYQKQDRYQGKPASAKLESIKRSCIGPGTHGGGCGKSFKAKGKFNRVCENCASIIARNG